MFQIFFKINAKPPAPSRKRPLFALLQYNVFGHMPTFRTLRVSNLYLVIYKEFLFGSYEAIKLCPSQKFTPRPKPHSLWLSASHRPKIKLVQFLNCKLGFTKNTLPMFEKSSKLIESLKNFFESNNIYEIKIFKI